ncbi:hypothetical protein PHJA_001495100 [Phtheirospermum japonicum]|uniref:Uncharacterized protein n=1 Tax=Phtheirospermum japonicum TaxID=374723 RepID=A0A830BZ63_9LAMI|nr:hypothetical protein PHJA_001495100 [Phtheirospermum japonicum]
MSRCFPFPPPGYENKARPDNDDLNLIVKKDKDKKHKDKKDKDKKERSERKYKERIEGKHKEDKDRKQKKHRDKKDKKKDKQKSAEEKNVFRPSENQNGEKPSPYKPGDEANGFRISAEMGKRVRNDNGPTDKKKAKHESSEEKKIVVPVENPGPDNSKPSYGANGYRISVETGKGVRNDDVATDKKKDKWIVGSCENQNGEKSGSDGKPVNRTNGFRISVETGKGVRNDDGGTDKKKETKIVAPPGNQNGEKPGPVNKPGNGANGYRISVEEGKRVGNDDGATDNEKKNAGPSENQNGERPGLCNKLGGGIHNDRILVEMGKRVRNDDGATDNSYGASIANGHSLGVDAKGSGNNSGEKRIKVENGSCQANTAEKKKEGKEKNKNRDKSKKEDKKRKKEEKKNKVKDKSKEKIKQRASDVNLLNFCANKPEDLLKESWDKQGKLPKLKEPVLNGVLHENGTRSDNMSGPAISSRQVSQNGNGSHPSQKNTIIPLAVEKQAVIANPSVNGTKLPSPQSVIKNVRTIEPSPTENNSIPELVRAHTDNHAVSNGFIPSHPLVENGRKLAGPDNTGKTVNKLRPVLEGKKDISSRPPSASAKPKKKVGTFIKAPPHPDLKYLSQILTVPKLESPLFDDDQEWLFGCKDAKRPKLGISVVECTDRVWAEAIRLESADVIALPYVVPY